MNWKLKAAIQNAIAALPPSASYETYYWVQKHLGGLRKVDPTTKLNAGIETWKRIIHQNQSPSGKVFLEIGTGRIPLVPLAYWLMGAGSTITVDLNPYLKKDLVAKSLNYIVQNEEKILNLFGPLIDTNRYNKLLQFSKNPEFLLPDFLELCNINYIAPGDAADMKIPDGSVDFHTSYTVFEHIPENILMDILREGNRVIRTSGLFVHRIDYSDHFSHSDVNISAINFLQFSDEEWSRYANNRYMYMNRLRHDDYINLFQKMQHEIVEAQTGIDQHAKEILKNESIKLSEKFNSKTNDTLAVRNAWLISKKTG